jgi:hypothetical protein
VLLEKAADQGWMSGFGADYTRFIVPADAGAPGRLVPVTAEAVAGEHLIGRPR